MMSDNSMFCLHGGFYRMTHDSVMFGLSRGSLPRRVRQVGQLCRRTVWGCFVVWGGICRV